MNSFTWIATIMSMVLGLGVARLLTDFINTVRARRATRIDWVPLAWAFCIFLTQVQFWWAFGQLSVSNPDWEFVEFLGLVTVVVLLFAAAAQLLPSSDSEREIDLRQFFAERGRWALVTLSVYFVLTAVANAIYFDARLLAISSGLHFFMIALPMLVFFSRSVRVQEIATAIAVPLYVFDLVAASEPSLYSLIS
jgi:hypothetical protein